MKIKVIRSHSKEYPLDRSIAVELSNGKRYHIVTFIRDGDCNPETDARGCNIAWDLERKIEAWNPLPKDDHSWNEEGEAEITDCDLGAILAHIKDPIYRGF